MMPTGPVTVPTTRPFPLESRHPAVNLAGLVLALIGWLAVPGWCLPGLWALQVAVLWWCGFSPSALGPAVKPVPRQLEGAPAEGVRQDHRGSGSHVGAGNRPDVNGLLGVPELRTGSREPSIPEHRPPRTVGEYDGPTGQKLS